MTDCLFNYIHKMSGCQLDWFNEPSLGIPICEGVQDIEKMFSVLESIGDWTYSTIVDKTGIMSSPHQKLSKLHLKFQVVKFLATNSRFRSRN